MPLFRVMWGEGFAFVSSRNITSIVINAREIKTM